MIEALIRQLASHGHRADAAPYVESVVLARADGRVVLVGPNLRRFVASRASRLAAAGLELVPTPGVLLDAESGHVRIPEVPLRISLDALVALAGATEEQIRRALEERLLLVEAWVLPTLDGTFVPARRSAAVAAAANDILDRAQLGPEFVHRLSRTMQAATPIAAGGLAPWKILDHLARMTMLGADH